MCACACIEYTRDAYQQPERLMLVHKAVSSDADDQLTVTSGTLAKLSPPTKRTGRHLYLYTVINVFTVSVSLAVWLQ